MTIPQHAETARAAIEIQGLTKSFGPCARWTVST